MGASLSIGELRFTNKLILKKADSKKHQLSTPSADTVPEFSDKEKVAIRTNWAKLETIKDELAVEIFLRIFELRPELKDFFPFRRSVGEALTKHPYFKSHSIRFINAVRLTLDNLDSWEVIHIPTLRKLGQHHTRIPGFTHDMFEVFFFAMDDIWRRYLGRTYCGMTRKAWSKIFKFIIAEVEAGYREGLEMKAQRNQQRNGSLAPAGPSDASSSNNTGAPATSTEKQAGTSKTLVTAVSDAPPTDSRQPSDTQPLLSDRTFGDDARCPYGHDVDTRATTDSDADTPDCARVVVENNTAPHDSNCSASTADQKE